MIRPMTDTDTDICNCLRAGADALMTIGGLQGRDLRVKLHRDAADRIEALNAEVARLTIDRDYYRAEATGATAQRVADLEQRLAAEEGSSANDRFELTEEIKRLTAQAQSLRTAGEHSEVKFMAALDRVRALETLLADLVDETPEAVSLDIQARVSAIPEGIDQREADIALSKEVEQQALTQLVVEAGALMFCGERDPVAIAGKALLGLFRSLDREDLLADIDEALPGYIADIAKRVDPDDIDGDE